MNSNPVQERAIKLTLPMPYHAFDARSGSNMLHPQDVLTLDPFVAIDSYTMPYPVFGPHPHAGMSAVTLMLPEADGGFTNRDSLGDQSEIRPGDLHWAQGGAGMMHEELPSEPGKAARGMQVFVNMAKAHKHNPPAAFHVSREDMPQISRAGVDVRVIAGGFDGQYSPIGQDPRWATRVTMLDLTLQPGASLHIPVAAGDKAIFVIYSGEFTGADGAVRQQSAIVFETEAGDAVVRAGQTTLRGVFFSGTPLNEPVVPGGPFIGNSIEDIANYKRAYARGDMGSLSPSQ